MNRFKNKIVKLTLSGIAIFIFGMFIGYQLNYGTIASIQGFLFNAAGFATDSNATDSNATDSNATNSNATNSNATNSNATNSNATNSNVSLTDNIIYLQTFSLKSLTAKVGEKVYIDLSTSGAYNSGASVVFNSPAGVAFAATVNSIGNNPYIIIPQNAVATSYIVTDVLLVGKNSNNTTFTKQYSSSGNNSYVFNSSLTIQTSEMDNESESIEKVKLNSISLETAKATVSSKVYIDLETSEELSSLKLTFTSSDNKSFNVYVKSLTSNPYFEVPTTTLVGKYSLTGATLVSQNSSAMYTKFYKKDAEIFAFNSTLEIDDSVESTLIYNNEDINSSIITELYNTNVGTEITINADLNSIINNELFNVIKGKDKSLVINYKDNQVVFNGIDINDPKTIDISMKVESIESNDDINKLISYGIVVNFPDNGNLPGKALIRIKDNAEVSKILNDKVYAYFYNESTNKFNLIDSDVRKTSDGYYEFTILHNSSYVLVNSQLGSKLVTSQSSDNVVSFQKSNKAYLMIIGVGVVVSIAVVGVIVVVKKRNNNI